MDVDSDAGEDEEWRQLLEGSWKKATTTRESAEENVKTAAKPSSDTTGNADAELDVEVEDAVQESLIEGESETGLDAAEDCGEAGKPTEGEEEVATPTDVQSSFLTGQFDISDGEDEDAGECECDVEIEAEAEPEDVVVETEDQPSEPKQPSVAKRPPSVAKVMPGVRPAIAKLSPGARPAVERPSVAKVMPGVRPAIAKLLPGARPTIERPSVPKVQPGVRPAIAKLSPGVAKQPAVTPGQPRPPGLVGLRPQQPQAGLHKAKGPQIATGPHVAKGPRPTFAAVAARPPQFHGKGTAKGKKGGCKGENKAVSASADDWEETLEISVPVPSHERGRGKGKGALAVTKAQQSSAKGSGAKGANQAAAKDLELAKKARDLATKALMRLPEKEREGKLPKLRNLILKKLQKEQENSDAQGKSSKLANSTAITAESKFTAAAKLRQATLKRKGTDDWDDEGPPKKHDRKEQGKDDGTAKIKATDPEGRKYDFSTIVVNMANVGATFSKKVLNKQKCLFDWEGVRRCCQFLKCERKLKIIGVLNENFRGTDNNRFPQVPMPADIVKMCASVEETPRLTGKCHSSADDEMTIKCAYRRNCRFLDNDNYRDWVQQLRDEKIRTWLSKCQDLLQMRYYFDGGLGTFDVLEGNIPAYMLAEGKADVDKRHLWTAKRA